EASHAIFTDMPPGTVEACRLRAQRFPAAHGPGQRRAADRPGLGRAAHRIERAPRHLALAQRRVGAKCTNGAMRPKTRAGARLLACCLAAAAQADAAGQAAIDARWSAPATSQLSAR